jgi:dTDP-4-dehydrorhamnose 3,5-epimerase
MPLTIQRTPLAGLLIVIPQVFRDDRGFLLESYHRAQLLQAGIDADFVQDNHSMSRRNVLRGLHYQDGAAPMGKMVRCTQGTVYDVAVDVRASSPTLGQWFGAELSAENMHQVWIPAGFAHGFLTLTDTAEVQYRCTTYYTPSAEGAIRWNDPEIGIDWPVRDPILSPKDARAPTFNEYLDNPAFE